MLTFSIATKQLWQRKTWLFLITVNLQVFRISDAWCQLITLLWKVSSGWHENCINYSNTTINNILIIVVYKIPCKNCERVYVWETGRPLAARVKEHCKEEDSITGIFTRAEKTRAASICNKSAITDHVCNENHVINWANAKVIDWESDKAGRLIKWGDMDQEDRQHESRWEELPVDSHTGQAFTYWLPAPEVSPDEGFWR